MYWCSPWKGCAGRAGDRLRVAAVAPVDFHAQTVVRSRADNVARERGRASFRGRQQLEIGQRTQAVIDRDGRIGRDRVAMVVRERNVDVRAFALELVRLAKRGRPRRERIGFRRAVAPTDLQGVVVQRVRLTDRARQRAGVSHVGCPGHRDRAQRRSHVRNLGAHRLLVGHPDRVG